MIQVLFEKHTRQNTINFGEPLKTTVVYWPAQHLGHEIILMDLGEKWFYQPFSAFIEKDPFRQYHLHHCLMLIDYLACEEGISIWELSLASLDRFLNNYYPKKILPPLPQQNYLFDSLKLLLSFINEQKCALSVKDALDYMVKAKGFRPQLAVIDRRVDHPEFKSLKKAATDFGLDIHFFKSLYCTGFKKYMDEMNTISEFPVTRLVDNIKFYDYRQLLEDIVKDAIGY